MDPSRPEQPFLKASRHMGQTVRPSDEKRVQVVHDEWRYHLHVPKLNAEVHKVGEYRITRGEFEDGERFVLSDYWQSSRRPSRKLKKKWRGVTEFVTELNGQESGAPNSVARWLTPRSPGNSRPGHPRQMAPNENPRGDEVEGPLADLPWIRTLRRCSSGHWSPE